MAYDYSRLDAVTAKRNARAAQLNKASGAKGFAKLDGIAQANKEFAKELDAARAELHASSPGGTYQSFVATRNPFRKSHDEATYLRAKHSGMSHSDIMRAGYRGTVPDPTPFNTVASGGIKNQYVAPENRTEEEWKNLDPAAHQRMFGWKEDYAQKMKELEEREAALAEMEGLYQSGFNGAVEAGGGTTTNAPVGGLSGVIGITPSPQSDDQPAQPGQIGASGGGQAVAEDPTSEAPAPGDVNGGQVVAPITVNAESGEIGGPGPNVGYLTGGKNVRNYYSSRFRK